MEKDVHPSATPLAATVQAFTDVTLSVFRLNGALLQWGDELVAPLGLTSARWQMLGAITLAGKPLTAPQVGRAMGMTRQGAQKQLSSLLDQGLVAARPNPSHRRSPLYELTARGKRLYLQADALWRAEAARMAAPIPSSRLQAAKRVLETMLGHLESPHDPEVSS